MDIQAPIQHAEQALGYTFNNDRWLRQAIEDPRELMRLAMLGDTVLQTVFLEQWFDTDDDRQDAGKRMSKCLSNAHFFVVGKRLRLFDCLVIANWETGVGENKKVVASLLEAMVGAVWGDCGHNLDTIAAISVRLGLDYRGQETGSAANPIVID